MPRSVKSTARAVSLDRHFMSVGRSIFSPRARSLPQCVISEVIKLASQIVPIRAPPSPRP